MPLPAMGWLTSPDQATPVTGRYPVDRLPAEGASR